MAKPSALELIVGLVAALGLAVFAFLVGSNLLPSGAEAAERGTATALTLTWGLIWATVLSGLALAGYLVSVLLGRR